MSTACGQVIVEKVYILKASVDIVYNVLDRVIC